MGNKKNRKNHGNDHRHVFRKRKGAVVKKRVKKDSKKTKSKTKPTGNTKRLRKTEIKREGETHQSRYDASIHQVDPASTK